ncbi:hypothetical protein ACIF85_11850 [Streptomyces sp. NPDC086033]|uniref:hypothetical protein n=1 Tax=Streptomyces sp. NPDC086033 TaxID=3365747 RepID=UPI0037D83571
MSGVSGVSGVSGKNNYTGAVRVFPGGSTRPTATGSKLFTASSVGVVRGPRPAVRHDARQ